jgi:phosphoribosylpyrophosphate synthetase
MPFCVLTKRSVILFLPQVQGQIGGFFPTNVAVENVRATATAVEHVAKMKLNSPVIIAPNDACIELARGFRVGLERRLNAPVGFAATVEPGPSRGTDRYVHRSHGDGDLELVGTVEGNDVVIVDVSDFV